MVRSETPATGSGPDSDVPIGFARLFARAVYANKISVAIFWPVVAVLLAPKAAGLMSLVKSMADSPPEETRSAVTLAVMREHFGELLATRNEWIHISCVDHCESAANDMSRGIVQELDGAIRRFESKHPGTIALTHSYFTYEQMPDASNPMLAFDRQAILLQWVWTITDELKPAAVDFAKYIGEMINEINAFQATGGAVPLKVAATGPTFLRNSMKATLNSELPVHELSTVWIPLGILAYRLRSVKMVIFPLISLGVSVLIGFGCTYFIALETEVSSNAPVMMLMLCVALTLDYSLFTLTRYREELDAGASIQAAIETTTEQVGHVIALSGIVLTVAYGALLALPGIFKTFCFGSCVMILVSIAVQLTFIPCLLALFPWLGPPVLSEYAGLTNTDCSGQYEARPLRLSSPSEDEEVDETPYRDPYAKAKPFMSGPFFCLGGILVRKPVNFIVPLTIYILMMPLTYRCMTMRLGHAFELDQPRNSPEWKLAMQIQRTFHNEVGCFFPMMVISTAEPPKVAGGQSLSAEVKAAIEGSPLPLDVRTQAFFNANCEMANALIGGTIGQSYQLNPSDVQGSSFIGTDSEGRLRCLNYRFDYIARSGIMQHMTEISSALANLWERTVSPDNSAMLTLIFPPMDPFSSDAFNLVRNMRETLASQNQLVQEKGEVPGLTFMTLSSASCLMDLISVTSERLPVAFMICVLICFLVIAVSFGAALLPVLLFMTVVLPITWSYGAAMLVYQDGLLVDLGIPGLMPTGEPAAGLAWIAPMFTLTIMLGLALDYAVFLFTRIVEFREEGFGDLESIQLGLSATGPIINAAGAIFGFSFIGMILGSIPTMNHMGFLFCFGVFMDTLVVRTILVPAVLSLEPVNMYWPREMPEPKYTWL